MFRRPITLLLLFATAEAAAQVTTPVASTNEAIEFGGVSGSTTRTLGVQGLSRVTDVDVRFEAIGPCDGSAGSSGAPIVHPRVGDITLRLIAPDNTAVTLMAQRGGQRDNVCTLVFDDDSGAPSIASVTSADGQPLAGTFAPENSLGAFDGIDPNGGWTLLVEDDVVNVSGTFHRFSLVLQTAAVGEITVDLLGDPVPDGCLPGSCSLREAIALANARAGLDRITLPAGEIQLARAGTGEDGNADGDLDVTDSLELVGQGRTVTTVLQLAADRVLHQLGARELTLRDLTLANGSNVDRGGAVSSGGRVVLDGVGLRDNRARLSGGALHVGSAGRDGAPPRFEVRDSVFEDNAATNAVAQDAFGGAIYSTSSGTMARHGVIVDSTFTGNTADNGGGALALDAIQSVSDTGILINGTLFDDNHVTALGNGGAIGTNLGEDGIVELSIEDSQFVGNSTLSSDAALDNEGGAIRARSGSLDVRRSDFVGNQARSGGALALRLLGAVTIDASTLCDNTASHSGGAVASFASLTLQRSTVCDNTVTTAMTTHEGGGGIAAFDDLVVVRSTFDGNDAVRGGAITLVDGDLALRGNTFVAPPTSPNIESSVLRYLPTTATPSLAWSQNLVIGRCSFPNATPVPDSSVYNTEASGNTCRFTQAALPVGNLVAQSASSINLSPLADNGGATLTRLPIAPSSAIDSGANLSCIEPDQRGFVRTDAQCDRGAVEAGGIPLPSLVFRNGFE